MRIDLEKKEAWLKKTQRIVIPNIRLPNEGIDFVVESIKKKSQGVLLNLKKNLDNDGWRLKNDPFYNKL